MTIWQRIGALFGRQYAWIMSDACRLHVTRAYNLQGIYGIVGFDGKKYYPLRKSTMSNSTLELSDSIRHFNDGSIMDRTWTPATKYLLAYYHMLPDERKKVDENNVSGAV